MQPEKGRCRLPTKPVKAAPRLVAAPLTEVVVLVHGVGEVGVGHAEHAEVERVGLPAAAALVGAHANVHGVGEPHHRALPVVDAGRAHQQLRAVLQAHSVSEAGHTLLVMLSFCWPAVAKLKAMRNIL